MWDVTTTINTLYSSGNPSRILSMWSSVVTGASIAASMLTTSLRLMGVVNCRTEVILEEEERKTAEEEEEVRDEDMSKKSWPMIPC